MTYMVFRAGGDMGLPARKDCPRIVAVGRSSLSSWTGPAATFFFQEPLTGRPYP